MFYLFAVPAQTSGDNGSADLFSELLRYGFPGLCIIGLLTGLLWAKPAVERIIKDKEAAEAQRDRMLEAYETKIIPALAQSTATVESMRPLFDEVRTVLQDVQVEMALQKKGRSRAPKP